jgi:hypothetical protein
VASRVTRVRGCGTRGWLQGYRMPYGVVQTRPATEWRSQASSEDWIGAQSSSGALVSWQTLSCERFDSMKAPALFSLEETYCVPPDALALDLRNAVLGRPQVAAASP